MGESASLTSKAAAAAALAELRYGPYRLVSTWRQPQHPLFPELVEFWLREGAIPQRAEAERRTADAVYVILAPSGEIAGACTVYIDDLRGPGDPYWFLRLFIRAQDRRPGMMTFICKATRDNLLAHRTPTDRPQGVVIVTENAKLMRPGLRRTLRRAGCAYGGVTPAGHDLWIYEF